MRLQRDGAWACPLCPFKTFQRVAKLKAHMHGQHASRKSGVVSTKQMRVIKAMWNHDVLDKRASDLWAPGAAADAPATYINRSASFLREGARQSPSHGQ